MTSWDVVGDNSSIYAYSDSEESVVELVTDTITDSIEIVPQVIPTNLSPNIAESLKVQRDRSDRMVVMRCQAATRNGDHVPIIKLPYFLPQYTDAFSKGLAHDDQGRVEKASIEALITALRTSDVRGVIKLSKHLDSPLSSMMNMYIGRTLNAYPYKSPPHIFSVEIDILSVYAMALVRDVPFSEFATNPTVKQCVGLLESNRLF